MHILNLEKFHQNRRARFGLIYVTLFAILIHLLLTSSILLKSDYAGHAVFAESIRLHGVFERAHPLYHFATILIMTIAGQNPPVANYGFAMTAGVAVTLIFRVLTAHIIYIAICLASPEDITPRSMLLYVLLTVGLLIFGPIFPFSLDNEMLLTGYIQGNVYYSSTTMVVIPFALLVFFASMIIFSDKKPTAFFTFIIGLLAAITVLAKPSFTVGFIPVLALVIIVRRLRGQRIEWQTALAIIIPSLLVLAGQFLLTYGSSEAGIAFRPFYLPLIQNGSYPMIFGKALASLIFPLVVVLLYRDALKEDMIVLAWLFLILAISYDWLLIEQGIRTGHRNFQWTAVTANFILFTVHILYLVRHYSKEILHLKWTWKLSAVLGVFVLHGIFGIYFYISLASLPN